MGEALTTPQRKNSDYYEIVHRTSELHRFGVSENRVLRRILVPKSEEVAGGWRRLHNDAWAVLVPLRLGSSIFRQETDAKE
jgi:hypothetical protein